MEKKKICLFTAHSPQIGGGGMILRSLIANLSDIAVTWCYVSDKALPGYEDGYLGKALMGGSIVNDVYNTWKMLADKKVDRIDEIVKQLLLVDCDAYWIVSHNEGLRIALELTRVQSKPVHLTIHDDWAGAICARSVRYRLMSAWAKKLTVTTLKAVTSVDVISAQMSSYYQQLSGIKGEVCHRYLSEDAIMNNNGAINNDGSEIVAGHIGSIYSKTDFIAFLSVICEFATTIGKKPVMKMWGCHLTINDVPDQLKDAVFFYDTLPEKEVVPQLANCAFVYSAYPFDESLSLFSRTSLPTKLTSYLQAGRPILGHGPADSTLASFLDDSQLGTTWTSLNKEEGFKHFQNILSLSITNQQLKNTRKKYFGENNLAVMKQALLNSSI